MYRAIVLLGLPGSGKGTQGRALGSLPTFASVSAGEVFRGVDAGTAQGREVLQYVERGELVPDDLAVPLCREHIEQRVAAGTFEPEAQTLILDGMPRTVGQAKQLTAFADVRQVLYLACDRRDELVDRLRRRATKEGRADDANERILRRRIEEQSQSLTPVLDAYGTKLIRRIDGCATVLRVLQEVATVLAELDDAGRLS